MGNLYDEALAWVITRIKESGGVDSMTDFLNTSRSTLYRVVNGDQNPSADKLLGWAEKLGGRLMLPNASGEVDTTRDVLFADAKTVSVNGANVSPAPSDYLAVPMVGEAGAGAGIIPKDEILSWVMVYRHHKSVQRRSNLIAVEIGRNQLSMVPTLHPGDIVLVDRADFEPMNFREIFLVREPGQEGGGKVKRVTLQGKGENAIITFSSDNTDGGYEPESRLLREYDGGIREAIVGKCVWGWTDLSGK